MKYIIDLPDKTIAHIRSDYGHKYFGCIGDEDKKIIMKAIYNGTPLPKGHGRLIDAKDAIETLQIMFARDEDIQNACEQCISDCPTVIEADKENKK